MKTEPRVKTKEPELPEEKKDDLFTKLIMGEDVT